MILGLSIPTFTFIHVLISLAGILSGGVVLAAMLKSRHLPAWAGVFLATTSLTGFLFPVPRPGPGPGGRHHLPSRAGPGPARPLWVQARLHLALGLRGEQPAGPLLQRVRGGGAEFPEDRLPHELAPTQKELPFGIAQGVVLLAFLVLGVLAVRRFHPKAG